ncbi:MAG: hypothetical protein GY950_32075 [bacterium]|nr:hypothetical protein [bacterium]
MNRKRYFTYLVYALVFLLSLVLFDRGLFYVIRAEEKKSYKKKDFRSLFTRKRNFNRRLLELPVGTYNTLIMGSSRTHRGIHPQYIYKRLGQKAFKIARGKARCKFNYFFYKEYKKYAGIPEVVIYGLDYFIFNLETDPNFMQYLSGTDDRKTNGGPLLLVSNKPRIDAFLTNLLETFNRYQPPGDSPGRKMRKGELNVIDPFIGYGKQEPFDERRPSRFERFRYIPFPGKEGVWFLKLLSELKKDGVTVVLVFLPEYIGTYESNFQREVFEKDIRGVVKPFGNVFIYNYNRPETFPLTDAAYFLDGGYGKSNSHLSGKGARVFNRLLSRDLEKHFKKGS